MTIGHDPIRQFGDNEAFVFAELCGFTCSICAPASWPQEEVEQLLCEDLGEEEGTWGAVDKSTIGLGSPTPNPCNQDPNRKHWFMMRNP